MFSKKKGEEKYLKKMPVRQGLITLGMILLSAAVFMLGYYLTKGPKNLLTIVAVLGMLPAAKSLVSMIMYIKAEKHTCSSALSEKIKECLGKDQDYGNISGYDFYMTSYEKSYPIAFCIAKKGCLIGITESDKCDINAAKKHMEDYLSKNGITGINVKFFADEGKFLARLKELIADKESASEQEIAAYALVKSLSL